MMSAFVVAMQVGMWFGYVTFGFISDRIGRKKTYIGYLLSAAVLLFLYVTIRVPMVVLVLGPFLAFVATGYFSGFGAVTAEIYPTSIRASAQGFTYNIGRVASAARAVGRRLAGADPRLRDRPDDFLGRVPARRGDLDLDPGNEGPAARISHL